MAVFRDIETRLRNVAREVSQKKAPAPTPPPPRQQSGVFRYQPVRTPAPPPPRPAYQTPTPVPQQGGGFRYIPTPQAGLQQQLGYRPDVFTPMTREDVPDLNLPMVMAQPRPAQPYDHRGPGVAVPTREDAAEAVRSEIMDVATDPWRGVGAFAESAEPLQDIPGLAGDIARFVRNWRDSRGQPDDGEYNPFDVTGRLADARDRGRTAYQPDYTPKEITYPTGMPYMEMDTSIWTGQVPDTRIHMPPDEVLTVEPNMAVAQVMQPVREELAGAGAMGMEGLQMLDEIPGAWTYGPYLQQASTKPVTTGFTFKRMVNPMYIPSAEEVGTMIAEIDENPYVPPSVEGIKEAYYAVPENERMVLETMNPLIWVNPLAKFGPENAPAAIRRINRMVAGIDSLPESSMYRVGLEKLQDKVDNLPWYGAFGLTKKSVADAQAEDALVFTQNLAERSAKVTKVNPENLSDSRKAILIEQRQLPGGERIAADLDNIYTVEMDPFKFAEDWNNFVSGKDPVFTGQNTGRQQEVLSRVEIDKIPSLRTAMQTNQKVNRADLMPELGDAIQTEWMREVGALTAKQTMDDYKPNFFDRFNGNRKAMTSFLWLTNPRYMVRNATNNTFTSLVDGSIPFMKLSDMDVLRREFDIDEVIGGIDAFEAYRVGQNTLAQQAIDKVPVLSHISKGIKSLATENMTIGEQGARMRTGIRNIEKGWNTFWENAGHRYDDSGDYLIRPNAHDMPELHDMPDEIKDAINFDMRMAKNQGDVDKVVEKIKTGQESAATYMRDADLHSATVDDINAVQRAIDEDDPDILRQRIRQVEMEDAQIQLDDPSPTIASDYDMTPDAFHERFGSQVRTGNYEEMLELNRWSNQYSDRMRDFARTLFTMENPNVVKDYLPHVWLDIQGEFFAAHMAADRRLRRALEDIRQGGRPDVVWPQYFADRRAIWTQGFEDMDATIRASTEMVERMARGEVNPAMYPEDAWERMRRLHEDYMSEFKKFGQYVDPRDPDFYTRVHRNRLKNAEAMAQAFAEADGDVAKLSRYVAGFHEVNRITGMQVAFIDRLRPIIIRQGYETWSKFREEAWNILARDQQKVWAAVRESNRTGKPLNFNSIDSTYEINRLIDNTNWATTARGLANEAGIATASEAGRPTDRHMLNSINFAIRDHNAKMKTNIPMVLGDGNSALASMTDDQRQIAMHYWKHRKVSGDETVDWTGVVNQADPDPNTSINLVGNDTLRDANLGAEDLQEGMAPTVGRSSAQNSAERSVMLNRIRQQMIDNQEARRTAVELGEDIEDVIFSTEQYNRWGEALGVNFGNALQQAKLMTKLTAKQMTDHTLLNYGRRRYIDSIMELAYPYSFWPTRSGWNWAQRIAHHPVYMLGWQSWRKFLDSQIEGDPQYRNRFRGKIRINVPEEVSLPETWGLGDVSMDIPWLDTAAREFWIPDPVTQYAFPFTTWTADTDWYDPDDANSAIGKWTMWQNAYGFGPYPGIAEMQRRYLNANEDDVQWQPPQGMKDISPWLGVVGDISAIMEAAGYGRGMIPPGGYMWANGRWDIYRTQRALASMIAEEIGLPPDEAGDYSIDDVIEWALNRKQTDDPAVPPDIEMIQEYRVLVEALEDFEQQRMTPEEFQTLMDNPIMVEAIRRAGTEKAINSLFSFFTGSGIMTIAQGEKAQNVYSEIINQQVYDALDNPYGFRGEEGEGGYRDWRQYILPESQVKQSGELTIAESIENRWQLAELDDNYFGEGGVYNIAVETDPGNFWLHDSLMEEYYEGRRAILEDEGDAEADKRRQWYQERKAEREGDFIPDTPVEMYDGQVLGAEDDEKFSNLYYGAGPAELTALYTEQIYYALKDNMPKYIDYLDEDGNYNWTDYTQAKNDYIDNLLQNAIDNPEVRGLQHEMWNRVGVIEPDMQYDEESQLMRIASQEPFTLFLNQYVTPLQALSNTLEGLFWQPKNERDAEAVRRFGQDVLERRNNFWDEAEARWGNEPATRASGRPLRDRSSAYTSEVYGQFGEDIYDLQSEYYRERDAYFPNIKTLQDTYNQLKAPTGGKPNAKSRAWLKRNPLLISYWNWYDQPEVEAKYDRLFSYWDAKGPLREAYGLTGWYEGKDALEEKYNLGDYRTWAGTEAYEQYPPFPGGPALSFVEDVMRQYPGQWTPEMLAEAYGDVALVPDSDMIWLIKEEWDLAHDDIVGNEKTREELQQEGEALEFLPGTPLPEGGEEEDGGATKKTSSSSGRGRSYRRGGYRSGYSRSYRRYGGGGGYTRRPRYAVPRFTPGSRDRRSKYYFR